MIPPGYPGVSKNVRKFWLAVWPALANIEIYIYVWTKSFIILQYYFEKISFDG